MKKAEIRQRAILKHLIEYGEYAQKDIMKDHDIRLRSMKSDIAFLNAQGHVIESVNGVYHLINRDSDIKNPDSDNSNAFYDSADRIKIRKLILTLIIAGSKKGYSADDEGIDSIVKKIRNDDSENAKDIFKTIENTLTDMLEEGELLISGGKYVLTSTAPIQMPLSENDAVMLLDLIGDTSKGSPYEDILDGIAYKLELALLGQEMGQKQYTKRVLQGGKVKMNAGFEKVIEKLEAAHYTENFIRINHKNKYGEDIDVVMEAGMLLYVPGKKKLYLVGETGKRRIVIDCMSITSVNQEDGKNTVFKSTVYKELAETMFEISNESPVHVKVRFDNISSIRDKLNRVAINRKYADVYELDGSIIYEDEVSGLNDFAHFIRRFGYGAEVIEPIELRDKMIKTTERVLAAYGQKL